MAHLQKRFIAPVLHKQLKFWPILTLFGPRQSGKSTFLREMAFEKGALSYVSFDRIQIRASAQQNPERFLSSFQVEPIVIDEAHKAPEIFDEIKANVDERRLPGRFILTGSVQFSKKIGIRESFTGRAATIRLDSMVLKETTSEKPTLAILQRYFKSGGMPGVCFLRDPLQIERYWDEWVETTCQRDLIEISKGRLSGDLGFQIIEAICQLEFAGISEIAKKLKVDSRRIKTHLEALSSLSLIRTIYPGNESVGKELFLPFDTGMASHFKANTRRLWQTWFAHEFTNQLRFSGKKDLRLCYHLTQRGSFVDFVTPTALYLFSDDAFPTLRTQKTVFAAEKRYPKLPIIVSCATDQPEQKISKQSIARGWASFSSI